MRAQAAVSVKLAWNVPVGSHRAFTSSNRRTVSAGNSVPGYRLRLAAEELVRELDDRVAGLP